VREGEVGVEQKLTEKRIRWLMKTKFQRWEVNHTQRVIPKKKKCLNFLIFAFVDGWV